MIHSIGVIRRGEQSFIKQRLQEYGLVPVEAFTLYLIASMSGCNQDAIGTRLEVDKGRVAKLLASLEEDGQIQRTINAQNKREKIVALTAKGELTVKRVANAFAEWNQICLQGFSEQERAQYFTFLNRISENVAKNRKANWCFEEKKNESEFHALEERLESHSVRKTLFFDRK